MKRITEDIKTGNFRRLYLILGQEAYLRIQYRDMLKKAMVSDDMNCNVYEGNDISIPAIIDQAETMPFFADRRLIIIQNSGLLKSGGEDLAAYLPTAPENTCFIICESEADKRSKLYKACQNMGIVVAADTPDEMTLKKWVNKMLADSGKKMTERDIEYFLKTVGYDMFLIRNETEKLISYCGEREIAGSADVDMICTSQINDHIFDMVDAIGSRNRQKAMDLYYDLLRLREPAFRILSLIARQFNLLLQAKELLLKNSSKQEILSKVPIPSFYVNKYIDQTRRFDMKALKNALEKCVETDASIKSGNMKDTLSIELLISELSA
ncbi:MAG: DNA polymerase III subunit delta [Lachnospiraceae bacterium]|nr:DNA polymerase III subunit delta [Lachnospiraceae bacterium]